MVVEHPEARADNSLAIAGGIPGQTNAGGDIVIVARNSFHNAESLLRGGIHGGSRREERTDFRVIAHTVIDSQVPVQPPVVLEEVAHRDIIEGIVGISDSLDVRGRNSQAIGLQACCARQGDSGNAVRKTERGGRKAAEVHDTAEIKFKNLRLLGAQLNEIEVGARLESVMAAHDGQVVRELESPLDAIHSGVRLASEVRKPRYIHADIGATRKL